MMLNVTLFRPVFLAIYALVGTCGSIICGGCDFIEPGECLAEGELFGPCAASTEQCSHPELQCFSADKGTICLPPAAAADIWEVAECAAWRGTMACSKEADLCFLTCDGPDACEGGTVCDEAAGMCVYPREKVGECDPTQAECPEGQYCHGTKLVCVPAR